MHSVPKIAHSPPLYHVYTFHHRVCSRKSQISKIGWILQNLASLNQLTCFYYSLNPKLAHQDLDWLHQDFEYSFHQYWYSEYLGVFEGVRFRSVSLGLEGDVWILEVGSSTSFEASEPSGLLYLRLLNYKVRLTVIRVSPSEDLYEVTVWHTWNNG